MTACRDHADHPVALDRTAALVVLDHAAVCRPVPGASCRHRIAARHSRPAPQDHDDGEAHDAFAAPDRPEVLGPTALHRHRRAHRVAEALLHLGTATAPAEATRTRPSSRRCRSTILRRRPSLKHGVAASIESAPSRAGSVSGNSSPRSPRPAAPSNPSATAWAIASPSLWPTRPGNPGNTHPPRTNGRPGSVPARWTSNP